jgi:hypothetical protein
MKRGRPILVAGLTTATLSRRRFLGGTAAGAIAFGTGTVIPTRRANARPVYKSGDVDALVVSDGHFICTHPVKTAEMVVDNASSVVIGGDYAAAFC